MDFLVATAYVGLSAFTTTIKVLTFAAVATYEVGKVARQVHEDGKAWVESHVAAFTQAEAPAEAATKEVDANPWDAPFEATPTPVNNVVPFPVIRALPAARVLALLPAAAKAEAPAKVVEVEVLPPAAVAAPRLRKAINTMGIRELRKAAKEAGIKGYSRKTKAQLFALLTEAA